MRPFELLAVLAAAASVPLAPGKRRNRRRRKRTPRHRAGVKLRCRTLERYRTERATLAEPITSRFAIRVKALRAQLRAAGHHLEPMPGVDDA